MQEVTIINKNERIVINAVSVSQDAPRIEGNISEGINAINSFTFSILEDNPGYNSIIPFTTLVEIFDVKKQQYSFKGRVLAQTRSMDAEGLCMKEYTCESEMGYLVDSVQEYNEIFSATDVYLAKLLAVHNSQVEDYKEIRLGNVSPNLNVAASRETTYNSTWSNIQTNLINKHGGELQLREVDGMKYLDYLDEIGENSLVEIRMAHNLKEMSEETKFENFYTRLIPLGAKIKEEDEKGNKSDSEIRIGIGSANGGLKYIEDKELSEKYGIIYGFLVLDDIDDPVKLMQKAKEEMAKQSLSVSNKITAYDLYYLGLDIDNFSVGNRYPFVNEKFDITTNVRVVQKNTDINAVMESSITIGDKAADINSIYSNKFKSMEKDVKTAISSLNDISRDNINRAVGNATNLITGANGGFVILDTEYEDGTETKNMPWRILIMDAEDKNVAKNIIQLNKNGIGFSRNGINGPYQNAWTIDGHLVADFITTAKLTAGFIGGWDIQEDYISGDFTTEDGTLYRAYMQKPTSTETWVYSIQKYLPGASAGIPLFKVDTNGKIYTASDFDSGGNITSQGGLYVSGDGQVAGDFIINGEFKPADGHYSATFTTADGKTVTVKRGLITEVK